MKTVYNILRGMRRLADEAERGDCYDLRGLGTDSLRSYADLIEEAMKREREATREKSSAVGNAAAMCKALESVRNWCLNRLFNSPHQVTVEGLLSVVNAALSTQPRNCDAFSKAKILEMLEDRSFSKEDTIEWLFAEAKGEANEQK